MKEKFTKPEDLKTAKRFLAFVVSFIFIYTLAVYFFVFRPSFARNDSERSVEHEIEFFDGEENYKKHLADVEWFNSLECPIIEIKSFDGLTLKAYLYEAENANGTVLLMHGFHSNPVREYATLAKYYHLKNYNIVMPYQRSHGLSEGSYLTFGIKERFDCRDWILKINEMYGHDKNVFVEGISMGCATVAMALGLEDFPQNVRGAICDCGFTSPREIINWTMTDSYGLPKILMGILSRTGNIMANIFAGFDFDEYSTVDSFARIEIPVLFITGTNDKTVPCAMTRRNYETYCYSLLMKGIAPETLTKLVEYEQVPHAVSYLLKQEDYEKQLDEFLIKYAEFSSKIDRHYEEDAVRRGNL